MHRSSGAKLFLAVLFSAVAATACMHSPSHVEVEAVPLVNLAKNIDSYSGQTVRTCGSELIPWKPPSEWQLKVASGRHGAGVLVLACKHLSRVKNSETCLSGRIARRDGSLRKYAIGEERVISSGTYNYEWYLHQQCSV